VSLSEAGAEDEDAPPERRKQAADDARRMIDAFLEETKWHPSRIKAVAGALMYSKYNFLVRLVMKRIARAAGGDTDTSRDYDYTNWADLDSLVEELVDEEGSRKVAGAGVAADNDSSHHAATVSVRSTLIRFVEEDALAGWLTLKNATSTTRH
jgi:hypothetical protein